MRARRRGRSTVGSATTSGSTSARTEVDPGPDDLARIECGFRLIELGGVDYLGYPRREGKPRFEVHYVLLNPETHERMILKVGVDDPDPTIPLGGPLWMGADWMEREVFDMYGIVSRAIPTSDGS